MENLSRTVRFKKNEINLIEQFLRKNPVFDFSSLTRTAVMEFIRNPRIKIEAVASFKERASQKLAKEEKLDG